MLLGVLLVYVKALVQVSMAVVVLVVVVVIVDSLNGLIIPWILIIASYFFGITLIVITPLGIWVTIPVLWNIVVPRNWRQRRLESICAKVSGRKGL